MQVWVTTECSKTRAALAVLERRDAEYDARPCLDQPPSADEVREVLGRLGAEPWDIARDRESREAGFGDLPRHPEHRDAWIAGLVAHPRAIQRPIILLDDGTAVVARDADELDRILGV